MPPLPDLISDDLQPTPFPPNNNATENTSKTKAKNGKSKKKNEANMEQANKEKASKIIKKDVIYREQTPPSPEFLPSRPPEASSDYTSPVLAALGDKPFGKTGGLDADMWAVNTQFVDDPPDKPAGLPVVATSSSPSPPRVGHTLSKGGRGLNTELSPVTSPRDQYRIPIRQPVPVQNYDTYNSTSPRGRPMSMPTPYQDPKQHHTPHTNAYRQRDLDRAFKSRSTSRQAYQESFKSFDLIPPATDDSTVSGDLALLVANESSLNIYKVDRDGVHPQGNLEGLRGQVVSAKILPNALRYDQLQRQRPLIALIIHGPMASNSGFEDSQHSEYDPSGTIPTTINGSQDQHKLDERFQTTVEIYSLRDRGHVCTLFRSPPMDMDLRPGEMYADIPQPFGGLSIQTSGRFVILSSGISGEVYIYECVRNNIQQAFKCIGKTWTSTQGKKSRTWSTSSGALEKESLNDAPSKRTAQLDVALTSLSNRWLAIVPPVPSSKSTLHGSIDEAVGTTTSLGINSHTPSSQPSVTCELDTPFEDSRLQKAARDVTQEMIKGARWVGDQGMQAWKNYWNKSESQISPDQATAAGMQQQFPPTHANDEGVKTSRHPTLVSVIDLEKLSEGQENKLDSALQPIATFGLADGCSFLSFNPSGLGLLTANTKGDVCYVWDLMRMVHGKSMATQDDNDHEKPFVRQVARFGRVTIANIVEVVWAEPKGEKLAIVTDRGTVHVHDMPQTAFQWPPPIRPKRPSPPRKRSSEVATLQQGNGISAAFSAVSGGAQPIFAAVRGSGLPNWGGFGLPVAGAGAGVKSGRIVSTGLSKSMGAASGTVDSILRIGEARVHLPGSAKANAMGSTRWVSMKDSIALAVLGGTSLRLHSVISNADVKGKKRHSVIGIQLAEFPTPRLHDNKHATSGDGTILDGYWTETSSSSQLRTPRGSAQPISFAELETNAPYQPFHTDRRVNLNVYDNAKRVANDNDAWVFGEDIPTTQIVTGSDDLDETQLGPEAYAPMENVLDTFDEAFSDQTNPTTTATPVASSRRKKGKKAAKQGLESENMDNSAMIDFANDVV